MVEEDVFEHERYVPLFGWSHKHLLPTERKRYNRLRQAGGRSSSSFPAVELPPGWEWEGPWEVEGSGERLMRGWAAGSEPPGSCPTART